MFAFFTKSLGGGNFRRSLRRASIGVAPPAGLLAMGNLALSG